MHHLRRNITHMEYKFIETHGDLYKKVEEIRINIIRLHNRFCEPKVEECGESAEYMIDVFDDNREQFRKIIEIMLLLEGSFETYRNRPKTELTTHIEQLALLLKKELNNYL